MTLYRMADGTQGDPGECSPDDKGVLRSKSGMAVVIDSDGKPVEIEQESKVNMTEQAANAGKDPAPPEATPPEASPESTVDAPKTE